MTIHSDTFIPYEFNNEREVYTYIVKRCHGIKRSLRLIDETTGHLYVRCPVVGDYLEILGTPQELQILSKRLRDNDWYRVT